MKIISTIELHMLLCVDNSCANMSTLPMEIFNVCLFVNAWDIPADCYWLFVIFNVC